MALEQTIQEMNELLNQIMVDLRKAADDNKAAAQRVRTGTIKLEKVAKVYRKESVDSEKASKEKDKKAKPAAKAPAKAPAKSPAPAAKSAAPTKKK